MIKPSVIAKPHRLSRAKTSKHFLSHVGREKIVCACGATFWYEATTPEPWDDVFARLLDHFQAMDADAVLRDGDAVQIVDRDHPRYGDFGRVVVAGQRTAFVRFKDSGDPILFVLSCVEKVEADHE